MPSVTPDAINRVFTSFTTLYDLLPDFDAFDLRRWMVSGANPMRPCYTVALLLPWE